MSRLKKYGEYMSKSMWQEQLSRIKLNRIYLQFRRLLFKNGLRIEYYRLWSGIYLCLLTIQAERYLTGSI